MGKKQSRKRNEEQIRDAVTSMLAKLGYDSVSVQGLERLSEGIPEQLDRDSIIHFIDVKKPALIGGIFICSFSSYELSAYDLMFPSNINSMIKNAAVAGLMDSTTSMVSCQPTSRFQRSSFYNDVVMVSYDGVTRSFSAHIGEVTYGYIRPIDMVGKSPNEIDEMILDKISNEFCNCGDFESDTSDRYDALLVLSGDIPENLGDIPQMFKSSINLESCCSDYQKSFIPSMMSSTIYEIIRSIQKNTFRNLLHIPFGFQMPYTFKEQIAYFAKSTGFIPNAGEYGNLKEYLDANQSKLIAEGILNPNYASIDTENLLERTDLQHVHDIIRKSRRQWSAASIIQK